MIETENDLISFMLYDQKTNIWTFLITAHYAAHEEKAYENSDHLLADELFQLRREKYELLNESFPEHYGRTRRFDDDCDEKLI